MVPMIAAYGILTLAIFILWFKKKKTILLIHEKEIQNEKAESVLKTMQHITGIIAEHIGVHNAEIMGWVEIRKRRGNSVSDTVAESSKKIADALLSLSEISFVAPYQKYRPEQVDDFEKLLQGRFFNSRPSGKKTHPGS